MTADQTSLLRRLKFAGMSKLRNKACNLEAQTRGAYLCVPSSVYPSHCDHSVEPERHRSIFKAQVQSSKGGYCARLHRMMNDTLQNDEWMAKQDNCPGPPGISELFKSVQASIICFGPGVPGAPVPTAACHQADRCYTCHQVERCPTYATRSAASTLAKALWHVPGCHCPKAKALSLRDKARHASHTDAST